MIKFKSCLRGFLRINLDSVNYIVDKGKTLEPPVFPGTKVTPHTIQITRKLQQHSYFNPISWFNKCTKEQNYRNKHAYICLPVLYWVDSDTGLSMCLPSCTEKFQFMCIKMGKLTVYTNTKGYNVPALHKCCQPFCCCCCCLILEYV